MRKEPRFAFDWPSMSRDEFDRLVEAVLKRHHADAVRVWSPNDAGGDGGRDVIVTYPNRTLIYQLKFFPDGLTSKPDSRKAQIRKSFIAGSSHEPDEWILVFPGKVTDSMDAYVRGLPSDDRVLEKAPGAGAIRVDLWDRTTLDSALAPHRDLLNLMDRDHVLESARVLGQEQAVLADGLSDAMGRLATLQAITDDMDADWTADLATVKGVPTAFIRPKHPHVSPLKFQTALSIPADETALSEAIKEIVVLGGRGSVSIPGKYISVTHYEGPQALGFQGELVSLTIDAGAGAEHLQGKRVRLVVTDEAGVVRGDATGTITYAGMGAGGVTLEGLFAGGAHVTMRFPLTDEERPQTTLTTTLQREGLIPAQVSQAASLLAVLAQGGTLDVSLEGRELVRGALSPGDDEYAWHLQALADAASDLEAIQRAASVYFPMPDGDISGQDRVWLRALRIVHEGGLVAIPQRQLGVFAHPDVPESSWEQDGALKSVIVAWPTDHIDVMGVSVPIPPAFVTSPKARIDGFAAAAQDATQRVPDPRMFTITPTPDSAFLMYRNDGGLKNTSGQPSPWGLPGVEELPTLPVTFTAHDDEGVK